MIKTKYLVVLDQLIVSSSSLLMIIMIGKYLNAASISYYTVFLSVLFFFNSSVHATLVSYLYTQGNSKFLRQLLINSKIFMLLLFCIVLLLSITYIAYTFYFGKINIDISVGIVLVVLGIFNEYFRKISLYIHNMKLVIVVDVILRYIPLLLFFIIDLNDINSLLILLVPFYLFSSVLYMIKYKELLFQGLKIQIRSHVSKYYDFGKWLFLGGILQWLSGNLFFYSSFYLLGASSTGYLMAIKNITGFTSVIYQIYENYITPMASRYNGRQFFVNLINLSKSSFLIVLVIVLLLNIYASEIVEIFYSKEYVKYTYLLNIFTVLVLVEYFQRPLLVIIRKYNETKIVPKVYNYSLLIGVLLYPLFIWWLGIYGSAIALLILQILLVSMYMNKSLLIYRRVI